MHPDPSARTDRPQPPPIPQPLAMRYVLWAIAAIVPAAIATLSTTTAERPRVPIAQNPTPHGYTVSLLLFLVPSAMMLASLRSDAGFRERTRAWALTLAVLVPQGFLLDLLGASSFFTFDNLAATMGVMVPVVGGRVPVEEFLFYALGFVAILMGYLWFAEVWMPQPRLLGPPRHRSLVSLGFSPWSLVWGLALIVGAWAFKRFVTHGAEGFPCYFATLVLVAFVPTVAFLRVVMWRIHWRSFLVTGTMLVSVSMLWEGTMASPYQWWNYNPHHMIGVTFNAWSGLPVEAVLVWFAVLWATVVWFEVITLYLERRAARADDPVIEP